MSDYVCILVTASSHDEARNLARALLEARLAGCVKIIASVESHYWWQGVLEHATECQLVIKSRAALVRDVIACVKANHTYTVPEVIALPVIDGNPDYLDWLGKETAPSGAAE